MSIKEFNNEADSESTLSTTSSAELSIESLSPNTNSKNDRPHMLSDLVGRQKEKKVIRMMLNSVLKQKELTNQIVCLDHMLFYGPPGLGKTTIAYIIANELKVNIKITSGPALEKSGDLVSLLTNLTSGDILFIDEIHRLKKNVEEILYPAMEDGKLDIIIGQGPAAQSVRLNLPPFTLLGATTRLGLLSTPLRDRFGVLQHMEFYTSKDLSEIVYKLAKKEGIKISLQACDQIAKRSRGTARIAIRIYKRLKDFVLSENENLKDELTAKQVEQVTNILGIDEFGLDSLDHKILYTILEKFNGGPVGLATIASALSEEQDTLEDVYEPYLMQLGFIKKTPKGRVITDQGIEFVEKLGFKY